jgi:hypothetical protein
MTEHFANQASDFLKNACGPSDTTITLKSTAKMPLPTFRVRVGTEIMMALSLASGTTYNVTRAIEGTSAIAHPANALVQQVLTSGALRDLNPGPAVYAGDNDWEQFSRAGCLFDGTDETSKAQIVLDNIDAYHGGVAQLRPNARLKVANLIVRNGTHLKGVASSSASPQTGCTLIAANTTDPVVRFHQSANRSSIEDISISYNGGGTHAAAGIELSGPAGTAGHGNLVKNCVVHQTLMGVKVGSQGAGYHGYDANRLSIKGNSFLTVKYGVYVDAQNCTCFTFDENETALSNAANAAAYYLAYSGFGSIRSCNASGSGANATLIWMPAGVQGALDISGCDAPEGMTFFLLADAGSQPGLITLTGGLVEHAIYLGSNVRLAIMGATFGTVLSGSGIRCNADDARVYYYGPSFLPSTNYELTSDSYIVLNGLRKLCTAENPEGFPYSKRTPLTTTGATEIGNIYPRPQGLYRSQVSLTVATDCNVTVTASWRNLSGTGVETHTIFSGAVTHAGGAKDLGTTLHDCLNGTRLIITATADVANSCTATVAIEPLETQGTF